MGAADERNILVLGRRIGAGRHRPGTRERPSDDGHKLLQVERLRQVLVGAALRGLDRRHEGVLGAHDDDRQLRAQLLDAGQEVEGVLVGHHHVGDDQIALPLSHPAPESRGVAGRADLISGPRQGLIQDGSDGGIVVGEENLSARHVSGLTNRPRGHRPARCMGSKIRKVVRRGAGSHSTMPP